MANIDDNYYIEVQPEIIAEMSNATYKGEPGSFESLTPEQKASLKGDPGITPVKGVDYFTQEDIDSIVSQIDISDIEVPTKLSDLQNDVGYITSFTETDPTVPEWAKASTKPSYTASEVGAMADSAPAAEITSADIASWNNKSNFSGSYNDLSDKPTIPSEYTLPTASVSTLGGVKVDGSTITIDNGVISVSNTGETYTAGDGIDITNDVISTSFGGDKQLAIPSLCVYKGENFDVAANVANSSMTLQNTAEYYRNLLGTNLTTLIIRYDIVSSTDSSVQHVGEQRITSEGSAFWTNRDIDNWFWTVTLNGSTSGTDITYSATAVLKLRQAYQMLC